ncbi:MAG: 3-phosphoshikimate 1-carboxyvinyltransferase [Wenzhouxiangella sp.]
MSKLIVTPIRHGLKGRCLPPGDKSISHRLAILGGLAKGETRIRGFLDAEDTRATLAAMAALGAEVSESAGEIRIRGGQLHAPGSPLDLGNSGTGMRLLCGALAGRPELIGQRLTLVGDQSLSSRPMGRVTEPLALMGARIQSQGRAPLEIEPAALSGIAYTLPVASAQIKSALLLAGLVAEGTTTVVEPGPSRDHSERLLPAFGAVVDQRPGRVAIEGGQPLRGIECRVPGDLSSATFAMAAALLVPDSEVVFDNLGINPTRDGILRIFQAMGGQLAIERQDTLGTEPVASLRLSSASLRGIDVPPEWVPLAIDEFPMLMAMAAAVEGTTRIRGAQELRVKESDRLAVMSEQLRQLGVRVQETPDGAVIEGGRVGGGRVDSHGDHRIAMSLAVLGLVADGPIEIANAQWIRTSYPAFVDDMNALGAGLEWREVQ